MRDYSNSGSGSAISFLTYLWNIFTALDSVTRSNVTLLRLLFDKGLPLEKVSLRLARELSSGEKTDCAIENGLVHDALPCEYG